MLVGGYARAFDLISTEYGWTDEVIGDLTLVRLRQITAAIEHRQFALDRKEMSRMTWQTRSLAQFIAAGYMTDGENPGLALAGRLAFDEIEQAMIEEAEAQSLKPTVVSEHWTPDMPSESKDNGRGSFEKFRRAAK
jgi:hypothetical protein